MIWGERERLARDRPAPSPRTRRSISCCSSTTSPPGWTAGLRASWDARTRGPRRRRRRGGHRRARRLNAPRAAPATSPRRAFMERGIPAVAGLRTALACAAALRRRRRTRRGSARSPPWQPRAATRGEPDAGCRRRRPRRCSAGTGSRSPTGRVVADADDAAVRAADELGGAVALKRRAPRAPAQERARARSALGAGGRGCGVRACATRAALAPGRRRRARRARWRRPASSCSSPRAATRWCRRSSSASAGVWTEPLGDVAIIPLPATPERVEAALRSLRGAGLLTGARGRPPVDLDALAAAGRGRRRPAALRAASCCSSSTP